MNHLTCSECFTPVADTFHMRAFQSPKEQSFCRRPVKWKTRSQESRSEHLIGIAESELHTHDLTVPNVAFFSGYREGVDFRNVEP